MSPALPSPVAQDRARRRKLKFAHLAIFSLSVGVAQAQTTVGIDSSSFLRSSRDRGTSSSTLLLDFNYGTTGEKIDTKFEASMRTLLEAPESIGGEAHEAYIATSSKWTGHNRVAIGRMKLDWSAADDLWRMGVWSPRYQWDPLRPETVGMFGAFYTFQTPAWKVAVYGTPISIPERGYPMLSEGGTVRGQSPFWSPLPQRVRVLGDQVADIRYSLEYPPMERILFRPALAMRVRAGRSEGFWGSFAAGTLPIHPADLAVETALNPQDFVVNAKIRPRFIQHRIGTVEGGYTAEDFSVFASLTRDWPEEISTPSSWVYKPIGPSWMGVAGVTVNWLSGVKFSLSHLRIMESPVGISQPDISVAVPERYFATKAWKFGLQWSPNRALKLLGSYTDDLGTRNGHLSADLIWAQPGARWSVGLGTDVIFSETDQGWLGQLRGNDRMRGRISYAF